MMVMLIKYKKYKLIKMNIYKQNHFFEPLQTKASACLGKQQNIMNMMSNH